MRRVFEKLIHRYCADTGVAYESQRTEDVLKTLAEKGAFSELVKGMMKSLYGVLSKSIHELSDEEVRDYYDILCGVIVMVLQDELNKIETEKTRRSLSKGLSTITSKIGSKE
jgi:hypothetical protein